MSMTLRLTQEQDDILTSLAAKEGVSKNEAALRAILEAAQRVDREHMLDSALRDTMDRYATTLKRLGE